MYQKFVFFGVLIFFGVAMLFSFQNCSTLSERSPVAVNNKASGSKISIYGNEGKEENNFKLGETAKFIFENIVAVCVSEPGAENTCVDEKGFPKSEKFSEITEGATSKVEKEIQLNYPGKMLIYGFTNDPIYPVISSSLTIKDGPKPASVE